MTEEQIEIYRKATEHGIIPDDMNPLFLFRLTHPHLLIRLLQGELDVAVLAKLELEGRGLDTTRLWDGFRKAEQKKQEQKKVPKIRRKL